MAFKTKSKFVTLESVSLRLTNKEFMKAKNRFKDYEERTDKLFKHIRSNKKLPKVDDE